MALVEGPSKDNPLVWEARLEGMAPEIDGKLYLTDIELPSGEVAEAGDVVRVEISKTDAYDLIGRVVEISRRAKEERKGAGKDALRNSGQSSATPPVAGRGIPLAPPIPAGEKLHRIATGAPLRVLG
jgi:hypothetical protein